MMFLSNVNSRAQARKARQRTSMGKTFWEIYRYATNFGCDVRVRPTVQIVGVEVGRKEGLWGRGCSGKFPWRDIAWPALHFASRVFLAGNHIDCR